MKILFVSRKFSGVKGGMEKVATELYNHLCKLATVKLIGYSGSSRILPIILLYLFIRSSICLLRNNIDVVYLQDGALAPLAPLFQLFKKPIVISVYGLDVTYKNRIYQLIISRCINQLNRIVCISNAARCECISRGVSDDILEVIPGGVSDEFYLHEDKKVIRYKVENEISVPLKNKKILLSVGRLIERKGIHWFIQNVVTNFVKRRKDFIYLVAGEGPYRKIVESIIKENNLNSYVHLLGEISDEMLKLLYNASDILVMPNIPVAGDMEGFGLVALESSSCGLPIVASDIEGVKDAVRNGKNGFRVKSLDTQGFLEIIEDLLYSEERRKQLRESARQFSLLYKWENIADQYIKVCRKVIVR